MRLFMEDARLRGDAGAGEDDDNLGLAVALPWLDDAKNQVELPPRARIISYSNGG